jgi:ADP-ribose pyrophosphatase
MSVQDEPATLPVQCSAVAFTGGVVQMRVDHVLMPDGDVAVRDVLVHPGSVGVVVLDDAERVLVLRQYRHPVARRLWELPAGLLDFPGESPLAAAQRELAEEAHLTAPDWYVLLDAYTSPGISDEAVRVYVACGATPLPGERVPGRHEEADLEARWVPLDELVAGVAAGRLHNPLVVMSMPLLRTVLNSGGVRTLRTGDFAGH